MASNSSLPPRDITQDHGSNIEIVVLALSVFGMVATSMFLVTRLCCKYVIPEAWRMSLIFQDVSHLILGMGLALLLAYIGTAIHEFCLAAGFFWLLGMLDAICMMALSVISLLFLQNPGKLGQLSTFRKSWIVLFVVPEKLVVFLLAITPVLPVDYFDTKSDFPVACFPVRQEGGKGSAFGAILFFILWILQILGIVLSAICAFRLWKSSNSRIHASSPNLWQLEKIDQGRTLHKMLLLQQLFMLAVTFTLTVVLYTITTDDRSPQWIVLVAVAMVTIFHDGVCGVQLALWSTVCCRQRRGKVKEPYQRLKKLELINVEGPGKLRLKASWSAGRGVIKQGMVKVYGLNQLKGWAQEIVVLGMLRKIHTASLLQCLWTANINPYFETMTMLSGQIVSAESRLICLELTPRGSLQDFLTRLDVPLPEACTRTIIHDLAEGLATLHAQNILHSNFTSAAVYLKGSVQRFVLRAAVGDFEEAQVFGTLQNGTTTNTISKKYFFLPDIRAFALVALEILGFVCKRRQDETQPHRLITSPKNRSDITSQGKGKTSHDQKYELDNWKKSSLASSTHLRAPGPGQDENDPSLKGGRIFVVGSSNEMADLGKGNRKQQFSHCSGRNGNGAFNRTENEYVEMGDCDRDSGLTSLKDRLEGSAEKVAEVVDSQLPPITHVREAYSFEFPNQSVFKSQDTQNENEYQKIEDIEEQIHREVRYNVFNRPQTGGYIVTRTVSGRELFIPAQQHNTSFGNSDSGYMGTSSNSSQYPYSADDPVGGVEYPLDLSWPKKAHRTTSSNTVSSFGDDILEILPGMTQDESLKTADHSLRQMLRAKDEAKVQQIVQEYEERVRNGGLSRRLKEWPKLRFSRTMADMGMAALQASRSRPSTPRGHQLQQVEMYSPRPQTVEAATEGVEAGKRGDKARSLSASTPPNVESWKIRASFKRNKARNELTRALHKNKSFAQDVSKWSCQPQRGSGGKLIEQKYASHNAAWKHAEDLRDVHAEKERLELDPSIETPDLEDNPLRKPEKVCESLGKDGQGTEHQHQDPQHHPQPRDIFLGRYCSFSSSDSSMTYVHHQHRRDTSLTSGELTSVSSQADTSKDVCDVHVEHTVKKGDEVKGEDLAVPALKLVDSGFDEDSSSIISVERFTCSCQSGTATSSDSCSCDRCHGHFRHSGNSPPQSGWSESQSSCGTWSNSNSFSSYDVQMHRRKLPSKAKNSEEHVIGPDEQYPANCGQASRARSKHQMGSSDRLNSPRCRNTRCHHRHQHHHRPSHCYHTGSSTSSRESSNAASRRYRELTQKGVPLRVSRVDDNSSHADKQSRHSYFIADQEIVTAEVIEEEEEEEDPDNGLYQDLDSQGFFGNRDFVSNNSSQAHQRKKRSVYTRLEVLQCDQANAVIYNHMSKLPPVPSLEDIIKEIPDETGGSCSGDESKAFLNRPESEISVKALKRPAPKPPTDRLPYGKESTLSELHREPRIVHEAELAIDRIFSKAHPTNKKGSESYIDPSLGLVEDTIRVLAKLPPVTEVPLNTTCYNSCKGEEYSGGQSHSPLLRGTDSKHVRYVHRLSDKVDRLWTGELLPADPANFDILKQRLRVTGKLGAIGQQLLDIIGACWIQETPPSTADIVNQLTDHVTETAL